MQPLPCVVKAYGMIRQEEKQGDGVLPKPLIPQVALSSHSGNTSSRTIHYTHRTNGNNGSRSIERRSTFRPGVFVQTATRRGIVGMNVTD